MWFSIYIIEEHVGVHYTDLFTQWHRLIKLMKSGCLAGWGK